jgi:hypothetical protein
MANRFRFSLKSLVVVVSFAAVLFGWSSDHWRLRQRIEELEEWEQYDAPVMQVTIDSGEMVDPISAPLGVSRLQSREADASDQADEDVEFSDR